MGRNLIVKAGNGLYKYNFGEVFDFIKGYAASFGFTYDQYYELDRANNCWELALFYNGEKLTFECDDTYGFYSKDVWFKIAIFNDYKNLFFSGPNKLIDVDFNCSNHIVEQKMCFKGKQPYKFDVYTDPLGDVRASLLYDNVSIYNYNVGFGAYESPDYFIQDIKSDIEKLGIDQEALDLVIATLNNPVFQEEFSKRVQCIPKSEEAAYKNRGMIYRKKYSEIIKERNQKIIKIIDEYNLKLDKIKKDYYELENISDYPLGNSK